MALRESINIDRVHMRHFEKALKRIKPSITPEMVRYYESWQERAKALKTKRITAFYA